MHIEKTKRAIEVMQAYVNGAEIEGRVSSYSHPYTRTPTPSWNWDSCDFRVILPTFDRGDDLPRKYKWVSIGED